jgi:hypothetical protein
MIEVGFSHIDELIPLIDGQELSGYHFTLKKRHGIQAFFSHDAPSDLDAKAAIKKMIAEHEEYDGYFISVQPYKE